MSQKTFPPQNNIPSSMGGGDRSQKEFGIEERVKYYYKCHFCLTYVQGHKVIKMLVAGFMAFTRNTSVQNSIVC